MPYQSTTLTHTSVLGMLTARAHVCVYVHVYGCTIPHHSAPLIPFTHTNAHNTHICAHLCTSRVFCMAGAGDFSSMRPLTASGSTVPLLVPFNIAAVRSTGLKHAPCIRTRDAAFLFGGRHRFPGSAVCRSTVTLTLRRRGNLLISFCVQMCASVVARGA